MESGSYGTGWWVLQGKTALSALRDSTHKDISSRPLYLKKEQTPFPRPKEWDNDLFIVQSSEGF
jgi:hypothetical protein